MKTSLIYSPPSQLGRLHFFNVFIEHTRSTFWSPDKSFLVVVVVGDTVCGNNDDDDDDGDVFFPILPYTSVSLGSQDPTVGPEIKARRSLPR